MNSKMTAQMNDMAKFVKKMNKEGICDAECQRTKKIDNLKNSFITAQNRMRNAPIELKSAEKAYYTEAKGSEYYNTIQEKKKKTEAKKNVSDWNRTFINNDFGKLDNQVEYYKSQYIYKNNVGKVYDSFSKSLNELQQKVSETMGIKNVNDRIGYFYDYNTNLINSITHYLKIMYWIFVIMSLILFIIKSQFKNLKYYPFLLTVLFLPYFLSKVYIFVMNRFRYFIINNIYLIFFTMVIGIIILFNAASKLPFNFPE